MDKDAEYWKREWELSQRTVGHWRARAATAEGRLRILTQATFRSEREAVENKWQRVMSIDYIRQILLGEKI